MRIAGVTILYNPDKNIIDNIQSYLKDIDKLYLIDNTEDQNNLNSDLVNLGKEKIVYIKNKNNMGIAYCLNKGIELAKNDQMNYLLTMDQDSKFKENNFYDFKKKIELMGKKNWGILSPAHISYNEKDIDKVENQIVLEKSIVMTSGNIIKLNIIEKTGNFRENFFIDGVDHEFCLRLKFNNFKILEVKSIKLYHSLGEDRKINVFGKKINLLNHNETRKYYIVRNNLEIIREYKNKIPQEIKKLKFQLLSTFIKVILFETGKKLKLKKMYKGYKDYKNKKFGEIDG